MKLSDFNLLDEQHDDSELTRILEKFNDTDAAFPAKTIVELFEEKSEKYENRTALVFGNKQYSYGELNKLANQYAHFLLKQNLEKGEIVALLFDKSPEMICSILGVIKAGGVYLPLDPEYPFERLKFTIEDSSCRIVLAAKNHVKLINKLQWECANVKIVASVDSIDFHTEKEDLNELMKAELWDFISEKSHDDISGGGWFSSYTGADIPREEMDEYSQNVYQKLKPHLTKESKVLEIGCSFGITMFNIAREVKSYYGTDLSKVAIDKTTEVAAEMKVNNVRLQNLAAHEIDQVEDEGFDIIIINSVIQLFNGHNYLRDVLQKCLKLMSSKGVIFLGDLQDQDKKQDLIDSLKNFSKLNVGKGFQTKTDWSHELFIAKDFLSDLRFEYPEIREVSHSEKIHTLKNELTEFRFDAVLRVDKSQRELPKETKIKQQFDLRSFEKEAIGNPKIALRPQDLLYVIYTSGSTGQPKGCKITHQNVVRLLFNDKLDFSFSENDVWIMAHSYYFDFSVWEMYGALLYGGKLILPSSQDVKDISKLHHLVKKHHVSVLNQTPLSFNYFIQEELAQASHHLNEHLRYVIFGGDKLDPQKLIPWTAKYSLDDIKLINMYGITETTVHVSYYQITEKDLQNRGISPIGRPLPETKIYILNEQLKAVPIGIVGEMFVGGTGVCAGYLNRESLTNERFIPNPFREGEILYKTGDQAKWLENGNLEYHGRIDFQVKIRGYRIELGEIESCLNAHPQISEAVVISRSKDEENELHAYFVSNDELDVKALREYLKLDLPDFMIPSFFIRLEAIPLTSNGKLNKTLLPDPYQSAINSGEVYLAPENETEEFLVKVWSEVLGISPIGVNDNFFSIGGDSLKAIRVVVQINKNLESAIKVSDLFNFQTVALLSKRLLSDQLVPRENEAEAGYRKIAEIKAFIEANNSEELPAHYQDVYPLTSIEKGMIFSSMLRTEEPVYYDQFSYHLNIPSEAVFKKAFELMVQKHPVLRSKYYMNTFLEPVKVVLSELELPISFVDLRGESLENQEKNINSYLIQDAESRLNFEGDILWHLKAFFLNKGHVFLVWSVHHSILDGWSESSFVTEFANLCMNPKLAEIDHLDPLKSTYKDYTAINIGRSISPHAAEFWKKHLDSYNRNKLPFNLSGKKIAVQNGMKRIGKRFDEELAGQLDELRLKLKVTPKSIYLAAYAYLMQIICSETEVVSGCVSNDRPEIEDGDKILGCFLNTIPFKVDFTSLSTPAELIQQVSGFLTEVKQHELYLLDIAHAIGEKSATGNPIFDCIFNYTDFHILDEIKEESKSLGAETAETEELNIRQNNLMTNTLFDVEVDRTGGVLNLGIKFALAYFNEADALKSIDLYEQILKSFVRDASAPFSNADLLSEGEKNWMLYEFNDTTLPFSEDKLMHQLFEERALQFPNHVALRQYGENLTYEDLNRKANRIADLIRKNNIQSGENVALICDRNFEMIASLLGILKSGAAYVPVDPSYPVDRQMYILENSKSKLVLMDNNYEITTNYKNAYFVNLQEIRWSDYSDEQLVLTKNPRDTAYTIYTSGSTGLPKGVVIEHRSAVNLIEWVNKTFAVNENDRMLFITSMCFDLSVYDIFGMLAAGGTIVIATQDEIKDPDVLQQLMKTEKITFWDAVPSTMNYLVDMIEISDPGYQQNDLRLVFMSGDWIPVQLPSKINRFFPKAQNISLGGATEATVWSNYYPIPKDHAHETSIPYGKPIDNNFFYILDDRQQPVPRGVSGELYIGGIGVAVAYANDPEKTNSSFFTDPFSKLPEARMYKTGDLGRMLPDGNMEFLGRKDFQVKIRGYRVELGEIENQLQQHPEIERAVVLAKEEANKSKTLVAYLVPKQQMPQTSDLKKHLGLSLPEYMIPGIYIQISKIPLTSNGKIDRKALPDHTQFAEEKTITMPKQGLESELAEIWKGILNLDLIGRNESVFELGAHSLHAGAFVSRLHKKLNYRIELKELFSHATIAEQGKLIQEAETKEYVAILPVEKADQYALSHGQKRLWIIDQLQDGESPEYNLPSAYRVSGAFDSKLFEQAVQRVIDRHEILRTSFVLVDDEPKQQILEHFSFKLELIDLESAENQDEQISKYIQTNTRTPFNLAQNPLFRLICLRKSEQEHILSFVMHHIISDGWSMGIMLQEVMQFYRAFVSGTQYEAPELSIQYKEYAAWQNNILNDASSSSAKQYWNKQLSGQIPLIDLPLKQERPAVSKHEGQSLGHHFSEAISSELASYCKEHQITSFMVLDAVVKILLFKYTGQKDLIVGSPVAGRTHVDLAPQIGFYVNTLALRSHIQNADSFANIVLKSKENILNALTYQNYPYDLLVEELGIKRQRNRNPLFDVLLVMQNTEESEQHVQQSSDELTFTALSSQNNSSKFDLSFNFHQSTALHLHVEFDTELFDPSFIGTLLMQLEDLLVNLLENDNKPIGSIRLKANETALQIPSQAVEDELEEQIRTSFENISGQSPLASQITLIELGGDNVWCEQLQNEFENLFDIQLSTTELLGKNIRQLADLILERQLEAFEDDDLLKNFLGS